MPRTATSPSPVADGRPIVVFVVAGAQQSGKSAVATRLAEVMDLGWISSSSVINERVEHQLGLAPGTVAAARAINPENYRPELIAAGNAMTAEGLSPGEVCVQRGYGVVDGVRRGDELEAAIREARRLGRRPIVVFVDRPGAVGSDNSEGPALRQMSDVVLINDAPSLEELHARVDRLAAELLEPLRRSA